MLAASSNIRGRPPHRPLRPRQRPAVRTVAAPDDAETETLPAVGRHRAEPRRAGSRSTSAPAWSPSTRPPPRCAGRCWSASRSSWCCSASAPGWCSAAPCAGSTGSGSEVDAITEDRLDRRVPDSGVDDEVGRLAVTMNRMLARLEASARRQRGLRRRRLARPAEPAGRPSARSSRSRSPARRRPTCRRSAPTSWPPRREMERLVGDLLVLASVDAGRSGRRAHGDGPGGRRARGGRPRTGRADLVLDTTRVSAAPVRANRGEVQRIVRNLLDNAVAHAETRVELRVDTESRPRSARRARRRARRRRRRSAS